MSDRKKREKQFWIKLSVFPWIGMLMIAVILLLPEFTGREITGLMNTVSLGVLALISAYIGMDLTTTVKESFTLAPNDAAPIEATKLIPIICGVVILCAEVMVLLFISEKPYETSAMTLFGCLFTLMTFYVAGAKANRFAELSGSKE
jgi:hypothetical protein